MHCEYTEILEAMGDPKWWDENAVPRYVDFHPSKCANIYADDVVLLQISCQACQHLFFVAMSQGAYEKAVKRDWSQPDAFPPHYGDPPRLTGDRCCPAGPTMNVEMEEVLERWTRRLPKGRGWTKVDRFDFESSESTNRTQEDGK